jgi:hypothetical protein
MSEQLLEAIIHLFSMLARLDGVGEKERAKMLNLLNSRLNKEIVGKYMSMFDEFCEEDLIDEGSLLEGDQESDEKDQWTDRPTTEDGINIRTHTIDLCR